MLFITPPTIETPLSAQAELETETQKKRDSSGQIDYILPGSLLQEIKAFSLEGRDT